MKIKIEFNVNNAAFQDDYVNEIETILRDAAGILTDGGFYPKIHLRASNGNTVGFVEMIGE